MDLIVHNPYRYLGVYSNSPTKERVANKGKMKAFLKVGKPVAFPLDLPALFSSIDRTAASVEQAEAQLALPIDQVRCAQFWWMKVTPLDTVAFNHLLQGNISMAESIWKKKDALSSLQNRFVLAAFREDWSEAIACAEALYSSYADDFVVQVIGEGMTVDVPLWKMLLDSLAESGVDLLSFVDSFSLDEWYDYVIGKAVSPLIDFLSQAVEAAKETRGGTPENRLQAGRKLMSETSGPLRKLAKVLSVTDVRYQAIVDKVGLAILQCGIDYYNGTSGTSGARPAMELQRYALGIVKGRMAKERCQENVDILQTIIDDLPPEEVQGENDAVREALRLFCSQPDKICHAKTLLETARPHLQAIRRKLGVTNAFYLKLSTQVVGNALHNVIEEVNAVQKDDEEDNPLYAFGRDTELLKLFKIQSTLEKAWEITLLMDTFDMDRDFKLQRYNSNRSILKDLCAKAGVNTSRPATSASQRRTTVQTPSSTSPRVQPAPNKSQNEDGCFSYVMVFMAIVLILGAVLLFLAAISQ